MLPSANRKLFRCKQDSEFDFVIWMDYVASNEKDVINTLNVMSSSPEWDYVEREIRVLLILK